jgi:hypothetical protein
MDWMLIALLVATVCMVAVGVMAVVWLVRLGRDLRRRDQVTAMMLQHQIAHGSGSDLSD